MDKPIIDDEVWALIEPMLPSPKPRRYRYPGRKPIPDRAALTGILFVLKTGIRWRDLPMGFRCGSGVSCWRRLRDWQRAGIWDRLQAVLLAKMHAVDEIDFSRVGGNSSSIRAVDTGEDIAHAAGLIVHPSAPPITSQPFPAARGGGEREWLQSP